MGQLRTGVRAHAGLDLPPHEVQQLFAAELDTVRTAVDSGVAAATLERWLKLAKTLTIADLQRPVVGKLGQHTLSWPMVR